MSGTFNKINSSLKVNQRKQLKTSQSSQQSSSSIGSLKQQQQQIQQQQPPPQKVQQIPQPPPLVQALAKSFTAKFQNSMPPMMTVVQEKTRSVQIDTNQSNSSVKKNQIIKGLASKLTSNIEEPLEKQRANSHQSANVGEQSSDQKLKEASADHSHQSQDTTPQKDIEDDPYIIKINIKNHSNIPANVKLPNPNYNILEQAKFVIMKEYENQQEVGDFIPNEDILSKTLKQINASLIRQREQEFEKSLGEYNKQILSLQAQISLLTNNQAKQQQQQTKRQNMSSDTPAAAAVSNDTSANKHQDQQKGEEIKKLKEENQELRMKVAFFEQDLQFQASKTKDLSTKYESEIENLRSQLKGSQSEQFVRQQIEHKKLIEDNSALMREVKMLQDSLREEQQRVVELFEDAQSVKEEILREMTEFEKTKGELQRMKIINKNLKKKLQDQSLEFSEMEGMYDDDSFQNDDEHNNTLGGGDSSFNRSKRSIQGASKKKVQQVSIGISRPESLLSLANGFNQKLEELIEEKSKSIMNVLAQSQINQFQNYYQPHPYAINNLRPVVQHHQQINQPFQPYGNPQPSNARGKVVEMSIYESEKGGHHDSSAHLENHQSPDSSMLHQQHILKSNSSDLQILKHKIKEVRDKHNFQIKETVSQKSLNNEFQRQLSTQLAQQQPTLNTNQSQAETFKAINSGYIRQESQRSNHFYRGGLQNLAASQIETAKPTLESQQEDSDDSEEYQDDKHLQNQFKTPVWTNQFQEEEDEESDKEEQDTFRLRNQNQDEKQNSSQNSDQINSLFKRTSKPLHDSKIYSP